MGSGSFANRWGIVRVREEEEHVYRALSCHRESEQCFRKSSSYFRSHLFLMVPDAANSDHRRKHTQTCLLRTIDHKQELQAYLESPKQYRNNTAGKRLNDSAGRPMHGTFELQRHVKRGLRHPCSLLSQLKSFDRSMELVKYTRCGSSITS